TRVLDDEKVVVEKSFADKEVGAVKEVDAAQDLASAATTTTAKDLTVDDITLAKALKALKTSKPKIKGIVVRDHKEPSESTTTPTSYANKQKQSMERLKYMPSMVKHLDSGNKFLMYPRVVQVFLDKQVEGLSKHNAIYVIPSHTKKVFGNIRRVGKDFFGKVTPLFSTMLVQAQEEVMGNGLAIPTNPYHTLTIIQLSTSKPQKKQKPRKQRRHGTKETHPSGPDNNVADEALNAENVSQHSNDPLPSGEDSIQLKELMEICTNLQKRVLDLETIKTNQAMKIDSLKRRVKKLEKKQGLRTHKLKRLYKGRFDDQEMFDTRVLDDEKVVVEKSFADKEVSAVKEVDAAQDLVSTATTTTAKDLTVDDITLAKALKAIKTSKPKIKGIVVRDHKEPSVLDNEEVVEKAVADKEVSGVKEVDATQDQVSAATTTSAKDLTVDDITLAKSLKALKTSRPKIRGIVIRGHKEPSESTKTPTSIADSTKPKAKGIVMEEPSERTTTTVSLHQSSQLQAEEQEEETIAREKSQRIKEVNLAWDDVQAKVDADYELAQRLQAEEQEQLTDADKAKLFMKLLEKRKKFFAAKRSKEKRNRPPTKAQQRSFMCTYLKNMDGWKPKALKSKSFAKIQELFNKIMKRINNFVPMDSKVMKDQAEIAQESS
nr:hypothetical protein [Tanacetum cinerariifolium]